MTIVLTRCHDGVQRAGPLQGRTTSTTRAECVAVNNNIKQSFHEEERAEGEGVDAGAIEAADGAARIGDQGLAE